MSFYSTNNKRFKAYSTSRRKEEAYYEDQQDQLDEILAAKRGEIAMVDRYAKLAKQVVNSFGQQVLQPSKQMTQTGTPAATDYLRDIIRSGSLSQWFDKIKTMDLKGLSKKAQIIVKDVKNSTTRSQIVEAVNEALASSNNPTEEAPEIIVNNVAGGDKGVIEEISKKLKIDTSGKQGSNTPDVISPTGTVSSDATTAEIASMAGNPSVAGSSPDSPSAGRRIDGSEYKNLTYENIKEYLPKNAQDKIEKDYEEHQQKKKNDPKYKGTFDRRQEAWNEATKLGLVSTINNP